MWNHIPGLYSKDLQLAPMPLCFPYLTNIFHVHLCLFGCRSPARIIVEQGNRLRKSSLGELAVMSFRRQPVPVGCLVQVEQKKRLFSIPPVFHPVHGQIGDDISGVSLNGHFALIGYKIRVIVIPLTRQENLAGVLFAATTVGLESVLAGLPTWRFLPDNTIAMDVLPDDMTVPAVSAAELNVALDLSVIPDHVASDTLFAPVAIDLWQELLATDD